MTDPELSKTEKITRKVAIAFAFVAVYAIAIKLLFF